MRLVGYLAAAAFLGCIVAANYVTARHGMVPVGFGLAATAGTYFAGATFVLRDLVHDRLGRTASVLLIVAGAGISALVSPQLAVASGVAFLLSEFVDLAVYSPLRRRGYIRAAVASNVAGSFVDTVVFLTLAGFPVLASMGGQMAGKTWITLAVVAVVGGARCAISLIRARRESVTL